MKDKEMTNSMDISQATSDILGLALDGPLRWVLRSICLRLATGVPVVAITECWQQVWPPGSQLRFTLPTGQQITQKLLVWQTLRPSYPGYGFPTCFSRSLWHPNSLFITEIPAAFNLMGTKLPRIKLMMPQLLFFVMGSDNWNFKENCIA